MDDRTVLAAGPLAVAALLLSGCSALGGADEEPRPPAPGGSASTTSSTSPATSGTSAAPSAAAADGSTIDVDAPAVASAPGETPGMVLEVLAVQRKEGTTLLTLGIRNEGTEPFTLGSSLGTPLDYDARSVALVDPVGLKRYLPYLDGEDRCLCSKTDFDAVPPGERTVVSAVYPALPDAAEVVTVQTPVGGVSSVPVT